MQDPKLLLGYRQKGTNLGHGQCVTGLTFNIVHRIPLLNCTKKCSEVKQNQHAAQT